MAPLLAFRWTCQSKENPNLSIQVPHLDYRINAAGGWRVHSLYRRANRQEFSAPQGVPLAPRQLGDRSIPLPRVNHSLRPGPARFQAVFPKLVPDFVDGEFLQ